MQTGNIRQGNIRSGTIMNGAGDFAGKQEWNPAAVLEGLATERDVYVDETLKVEDHVRKILKDNAPFAAKSIAWLAYYSENEKLRFDAARYILERVMGKTTDEGFDGSKDDKLVELVKSVYADAQIVSQN